MKNLKYKGVKLAGLAIACIAISACEKTNFENPVGETDSYNSGTADFSNFVSIGDSLTAGYADSALYKSGQENSVPAILSQQFAEVGGGTFVQPLVSDNLGGLLFGGMENPEFGNRLVLNVDPKNPPDDLDPKGPEPISGIPTTEVFGNTGGVLYNNVGVPGAKSFHFGLSGYGDSAGLLTSPATANPYFVRFASSTTTTIITDAAAQQPTFFTLWIGNNDVLSYATAGGDGVDQTGNANPTTYGSDDITDPGYFSTVYAQLVSAMTAANPDAKGVLLNIPDISTLPYFTTVPYNAVPLDADTAAALNTGYTDYNNGVQAALGMALISAEEASQRTISFAAGQNAVMITDEDLTDITAVNAGLIKMRQATADDLLVLTTSSKIGTLAIPADPTSAWGVGIPLEDSDVLIESEIDAIRTARLAFNATIKASADANPNLLFVDIEAIMNELSTTGINYGTGSINNIYASGGGFSLDGVHPTARAYSVIANRIIAKINSGFSANIPPVNPADYKTIFIK